MPAIPHPWATGRGVVIGALWGCHEGPGVAVGCDRSTLCWDKPGCPGQIIIDCWDKATWGVLEAPGTCWLHGKLLGYCRGGGVGVPDRIGRVHVGNPTKDRGSFPEGGRIGERDLSIITMMATSKSSSIWCWECYQITMKAEEGETKRAKKRKRRREKEKRGQKTRARDQPPNQRKEKGQKKETRREPRKGEGKTRSRERETKRNHTNSPVINKKVHGHQNCTLPVYSVHSSRTFGRPLNPKISKVIPRVKNIDGTHGVALQSKQLTLTVAPCPHSYHGGSPIVIGVEDLWYVQKE